MAASTNLTTLDKVKSYLNLSDTTHDDLLAALIASASEAIELYCGREFARAERTEYHDGSGTRALVLRCRPVESVTSLHDDPARVYNDATLIAASRYGVYPAEGLLRLDGGAFSPGVRNVRVVYTAGYAAIPPAVEQAANILVARFFQRGSQGGDAVQSESLGGYTVSYDTGDWPHQAKGLLAEFRETTV